MIVSIDAKNSLIKSNALHDKTYQQTGNRGELSQLVKEHLNETFS